MITFRRIGLTVAILGGLVFAQNVPLDALLRGGRIHFQGGRYERAREQFQKALEQYGTTADNVTLGNIYLWLGLCEAQLNNLLIAAEHFHQALKNDSTLAEHIAKDEQQEYWVWNAFITASREKYATGDYENAILYARAALKIHPDRSQPYSIIANAYSTMGNYDDMLATARQMLAFNNASAEAYSLIGLYFFQKPDTAWKTPEAKRARWDSTYHYYNRALQIYQARLDSALQDLRNILKTTDTTRIRTIAENLITKQRYYPPEELKRYIEKELGQGKQLEKIAQITSRLFYTANNLNVTSARLGTAMLRASGETKGTIAENYRRQAESLFTQALIYDPNDYTTLFNLGITQYQGRNDSLAAITFAQVIKGTVAPISILPPKLIETLLSQISPEAANTGYLQLAGDLLTIVDSTLFELGYRSGSFSWLYFPDIKERKGGFPLTLNDTNGIFLSVENPVQLENIYLLLGVAQTGLGLAKIEASQKDEGKSLLNQAIPNLLMTTKINPRNAEAYLNLVHCYREIGDKNKAASAYEMYKSLSK